MTVLMGGQYTLIDSELFSFRKIFEIMNNQRSIAVSTLGEIEVFRLGEALNVRYRLLQHRFKFK